MQPLPGLRGQSVAGPLLQAGRTPGPGPGALLGMRDGARRILGTASEVPPKGSSDSPIITDVVTVTAPLLHRGELRRVRWTQLEGWPATPLSPDSLSTQFSVYPQSWNVTQTVRMRCLIENSYAERGEVDVAFAVRLIAPSLQGTGSPSSLTLVPINLTTRQGTCYFSMSASGGVPPYTYDWGGGDFPNSASNQATFTIPPGAPHYEFYPGCTITDSIGQSIVRPAGPFVVYEPT